MKELLILIVNKSEENHTLKKMYRISKVGMSPSVKTSSFIVNFVTLFSLKIYRKSAIVQESP